MSRPPVHVHPTPVSELLVDAWVAALSDADLEVDDVALFWRPGRPRAGGQHAASWASLRAIDPEFGDDTEIAPLLSWANSEPIRQKPRVMVWTERTPEGLAGLLRHELEHVSQMRAYPDLENLHDRAVEEITRRGATGNSYNAIPMELDANRAAARFLRGRYGVDRLTQLLAADDTDAAVFRPTEAVGPLDTLVLRMDAFILSVMNDDGFLNQFEAANPDANG